MKKEHQAQLPKERLKKGSEVFKNAKDLRVVLINCSKEILHF